MRWLRRIKLPDRVGREHAVETVVTEIFEAYDAAEAPRNSQTLRATTRATLAGAQTSATRAGKCGSWS